MENCKDCIQIKNTDEKVRGVWHAINEVKAQQKEFETRITDLEKNKSASDQKFDRIFESIESINKNIDKIADALEVIKNKPAATYEGLKYEIIKYIVIAIVAVAVGKFM